MWHMLVRIMLACWIGQICPTVNCIIRQMPIVVAVWHSGSALVSMNKVNLRRVRLVLRWVTMSGFNSRCWTFISVCNQPATKGQLGLPSLRVGKWVPAAAGKAKAGMVHTVSGRMRGVQVKLRDSLKMRAIPERLRGVIMTNPHLPLSLNKSSWMAAVVYVCKANQSQALYSIAPSIYRSVGMFVIYIRLARLLLLSDRSQRYTMPAQVVESENIYIPRGKMGPCPKMPENPTRSRKVGISAVIIIIIITRWLLRRHNMESNSRAPR